MCLAQDYQDIPERSLVEDCALEHGIDFVALNNCASTDDGTAIGMLRDSVLRSSRVKIPSKIRVQVLTHPGWCHEKLHYKSQRRDILYPR